MNESIGILRARARSAVELPTVLLDSPIGSTSEYGNVVDLEEEGSALFACEGILNDAKTTEAEPLGHRVNDVAILSLVGVE